MGRDQPSLLASRLLIHNYIWLVGVYVHLKTPFILMGLAGEVFFQLMVQLTSALSDKGSVAMHVLLYASWPLYTNSLGKPVHFDGIYLKSFPLLIISEFFLESAIEKCSRRVQ